MSNMLVKGVVRRIMTGLLLRKPQVLSAALPLRACRQYRCRAVAKSRPKIATAQRICSSLVAHRSSAAGLSFGCLHASTALEFMPKRRIRLAQPWGQGENVAAIYHIGDGAASCLLVRGAIALSCHQPSTRVGRDRRSGWKPEAFNHEKINVGVIVVPTPCPTQIKGFIYRSPAIILMCSVFIKLN